MPRDGEAGAATCHLNICFKSPLFVLGLANQAKREERTASFQGHVPAIINFTPKAFQPNLPAQWQLISIKQSALSEIVPEIAQPLDFKHVPL